MLKVGVVVLLIVTLAVLCYLVFLSIKLLGKAEKERKAEAAQEKPKARLHPKLDNKSK